ncbi:uncharacterized protein [Aquarana catesbeiana]
MRTGLKILHIICFLLLLGSGDFQVRRLTVTGRDGPIEALRGDNVTIPCLLSGVPIPLNLQILSVVWTLRLQNGTEHEVYGFRSSSHQSSRPGSHMNDRDLQQGNASLSIPDIQIEDEGDYICFVIVTPESSTTTSTLHVSVKPQTSMHHKRIIEDGYVGSVFCEVSNFYPEEVKIWWVKHSKGITTSSSLDEDVSLTKQFRNSDGTFNVTSVLTVRPNSRDEPGDVFFCIVSHRSLKEEISLAFIVPNLPTWIYILLPCSSTVFFILLASYGRFLWKYFTIGDITISEISGNYSIPHMKRTTLTCQITNFRQKEIQINVYLKRRNDKKHLIASWESNNSSNYLLMAEDQRDNSHILPLLEKGAASRTLLPVEMEAEIRKSSTGMYKCLCSITITPSADRDNEAMLGVEVEQASLKRPISVRRTLNVYSPVVNIIISDIIGETWIPHVKKTTLSCQITRFRTKDIHIKLYLKRRNNMKKHLIHSWPSMGRPSDGNNTTLPVEMEDAVNDTMLPVEMEDAVNDTMLPVEMEDAVNDTMLPVEMENAVNDTMLQVEMENAVNDTMLQVEMENAVNDTMLPVEMEVEMTETENGSYKCDCRISLTPNIDTDDGAILTLEVDHDALEWPEYKYHILNVIKGDKPSLWRRWNEHVVK